MDKRRRAVVTRRDRAARSDTADRCAVPWLHVGTDRPGNLWRTGVPARSNTARTDTGTIVPAGAVLSAFGTAPRFRDRLSGLPALPDHRPCGGRDPDVDGHDDGAARHRVAAIQAGVLRRRRRVEPAVRCACAKLSLTLAQRLLGLVKRLGQVGQDGLAAGLQFHICQHTGPDFQRLLAFRQLRQIHFHGNLVMRVTIGIARAVVLERVGRDEIDLALKRAVDRVIIGGQLDGGVLILADLRDILGFHPSLDVKLVLQRNDLEDFFARTHHAADGSDRQLVDHAFHRRHQNGAVELILGDLQLLFQRGQLAQGLGIICSAVEFHLRHHVIQTVLGFRLLFARVGHLDQGHDFHRQHLFKDLQLLVGLLQYLLGTILL
ncbi:UNVERIFIED_CONTAM: hypothetical protein NCL1_06720 [Trichonephila clavipes]